MKRSEHAKEACRICEDIFDTQFLSTSTKDMFAQRAYPKEDPDIPGRGFIISN